MTDELKQKIKEVMVNLPKDTQNVIDAFDWASIAEEIGIKYLKNDHKATLLQAEVGLSLAGLLDLDLFVENIENDIGINHDEAEKITNEVLQKIFTPIKNVLEENVKKNLIGKNPNWKQTLNFILSGGDYSAFLEERNMTPSNSHLAGGGEPRPAKGGVGEGLPLPLGTTQKIQERENNAEFNN